MSPESRGRKDRVGPCKGTLALTLSETGATEVFEQRSGEISLGFYKQVAHEGC